MIGTTAQQRTARVERKAFQPSWLRAVMDDGDAGFLIEAAEEIAYINRAYTAMLGYDSPAQLRGCHVSAIVAEEDLPRVLTFSQMRCRAEAAPRNYQFTARRRDTSPLRLQASVTATRVEGAVLIATMVLPCESAEPAPIAPVALPVEARSRLSPRETQVLEMILGGMRMKAIAMTLGISPKTASTHRAQMMEKLHLSSVRDIFQYAITHKIVDWS